MNLYFWHIERSGGRFTRKEDFLGQADSAAAKRELLLRMVAYNRGLDTWLTGHTKKLEQQLARLEASSAAAVSGR